MTDPTSESLLSRLAELEEENACITHEWKFAVSEAERLRDKLVAAIDDKYPAFVEAVDKRDKRIAELKNGNAELRYLLQWAVERASDVFQYGIGSVTSDQYLDVTDDDRFHYRRIRELLADMSTPSRDADEKLRPLLTTDDPNVIFCTDWNEPDKHVDTSTPSIDTGGHVEETEEPAQVPPFDAFEP